MRFATDWEKGSTYDVTYEETGLVISHPEQMILESDPYRRLAYTWHTFTPGVGDRTTASTRTRPRPGGPSPAPGSPSTSRRPSPGIVKLTVVHDGFVAGSPVLEGVSNGWPAVLASLKTLLETGSALPS